MPRPPKHVGSFARSQANSETSLPNTDIVCLSPPSKRRLERGHHRGWDKPSRACADPLAHQHPRLCKADMIMWIARRSLNVLQRRESLLHSFSIVCVGASAGWPRPTCMQCCAFAADPSRLSPCRLRGIFQHRLRTAIGSSASSNCFNSRRPYSTCIATESVTCVGQRAFNGTPGAVERSSRPNEGHAILQANLRDLPWAWSSDLERANSSPSTNITCMAREPCHPPLVVLSTVPAIVTRTSCHKAPIGPRKSLQTVDMQSWPLPRT